MAKASPKRAELLTPAERAELSTIANARIPVSWRNMLKIHGKSVTDVILEALEREIRLLKGSRTRRAA